MHLFQHIAGNLDTWHVLLFLGMGGFFDLFTKKINNTATNTNIDNTRNETLTNSNNSWVSQNLALTNASSANYNSAFDAVDSFNTVNSFNIAGGVPDIPSLDQPGLRGFFTTPDELSELINSNRISADPNANKYNFDFSDISAGGSEFMQSVQGLVRDTFSGFTEATGAVPVPSGATGSAVVSTTMKYVLIAAAVIFLGLYFIKRK